MNDSTSISSSAKMKCPKNGQELSQLFGEIDQLFNCLPSKRVDRGFISESSTIIKNRLTKINDFIGKNSLPPFKLSKNLPSTSKELKRLYTNIDKLCRLPPTRLKNNVAEIIEKHQRRRKYPKTRKEFDKCWSGEIAPFYRIPIPFKLGDLNESDQLLRLEQKPLKSPEPQSDLPPKLLKPPPNKFTLFQRRQFNHLDQIPLKNDRNELFKLKSINHSLQSSLSDSPLATNDHKSVINIDSGRKKPKARSKPKVKTEICKENQMKIVKNDKAKGLQVKATHSKCPRLVTFGKISDPNIGLRSQMSSIRDYLLNARSQSKPKSTQQTNPAKPTRKSRKKSKSTEMDSGYSSNSSSSPSIPSSPMSSADDACTIKSSSNNSISIKSSATSYSTKINPNGRTIRLKDQYAKFLERQNQRKTRVKQENVTEIEMIVEWNTKTMVTSDQCPSTPKHCGNETPPILDFNIDFTSFINGDNGDGHNEKDQMNDLDNWLREIS